MSDVTPQQWTAALRSGKYKQGKNFLRQGDYFCCLGVLCDLIDSKEWRVLGADEYADAEYDVIGEAQPVHVFGSRGNTQMVPEPLASLIGLDSDSQDVLAQLNDSGKSFAEIADVIDAGTENIYHNANEILSKFP